MVLALVIMSFMMVLASVAGSLSTTCSAVISHSIHISL